MKAVFPLLLLLLGSSGCFPYREIYRPAVKGIAVDLDDRPLYGVTVLACSETSWSGLRKGCPRRGTTHTATDGSFSLPRVAEWEWCCLGEAPLPVTALVACDQEGRMGGVTVGSPVETLRLRLMPAEFFRASYRANGLRGAPEAEFFAAVCREALPGRGPGAPIEGRGAQIE